MKKKLLWVILILAVLAALILAIVLPRAGKGTPAGQSEPAAEEAAELSNSEPEEEAPKADEIQLEAGELPLDDTPLTVTGETPVQPETSTGEEGSAEGGESAAEEETPHEDPLTDIELEENELPLDTP